MNLGQSIKRARERRKMAIFTLAERVGLSSADVQSIENGAPISKEQIEQFARALDVGKTFLIIQSLEDCDIKKGKHESWNILAPFLDSLIDQLHSGASEQTRNDTDEPLKGDPK